MMLPTRAWLSMGRFMRASFDLAPADWLIGRWLFQRNWRIAFMPPVVAIYHCTGASFKDSSRVTVAKARPVQPRWRALALILSFLLVSVARPAVQG